MLSPGEAAVLAGGPGKDGENGVPVPHPDLSRTPSMSVGSLGASQKGELEVGEHTEDILSELGVGAEERATLRREGAVGGPVVGAKL